MHLNIQFTCIFFIHYNIQNVNILARALNGLILEAKISIKVDI